MIKRNQHRLNQLNVILDALVIILAYYLTYQSIDRIHFLEIDHGFLTERVFFINLLFIVPVFLIIFWIFRLYMPKRTMSKRMEFWHILQSNVTGGAVFAAYLFVMWRLGRLPYFGIRIIVFFIGADIVLLTIKRFGVRFTLSRMREEGFNQKHIILVGFSNVSNQFIDAVLRNPDWGYHIHGILDDLSPAGTEYRGVKVIGDISTLNDFLAENVMDEIVITLPLAAYEKLGGIVATCEKSGVHTKFIPDYNDFIHTTPVTEDMDGIPVVNIRNNPLTADPWKAASKRLVDIIGSLIGIIILSPLMLVTAIIVKATSSGPVLFRQERIGFHNQPFNMYKFRSMRQQTDDDEKKGWTTKNDPRVTGIGRFIRKTNIDELPQFFNVLKGDMSLVGPRPERPQFVEKFQNEIPRYMVKHQVRPGMTGWAQVNGLRGDTSIPERIRYDLWYIEHWTMSLDFKILFLTFFGRKTNKNAY